MLVTFNMQAEHEIPWEEMLVKAQPLGLDFMTGQMESALTTGTRHWHLVIHTAKVQRPTALLKAFGLGTNVKVITAGTEDRVIAYVTKEDTRVCGPYVEGTRPVKGTRPRTGTVSVKPPLLATLLPFPPTSSLPTTTTSRPSTRTTLPESDLSGF